MSEFQAHCPVTGDDIDTVWIYIYIYGRKSLAEKDRHKCHSVCNLSMKSLTMAFGLAIFSPADFGHMD